MLLFRRTVPNVTNVCLNAFTSARNYLLTESDKYLLMEITENMVFGHSKLCNRETVVEETPIDNSAELIITILGTDARQSQPFCKTQPTPEGFYTRYEPNEGSQFSEHRKHKKKVIKYGYVLLRTNQIRVEIRDILHHKRSGKDWFFTCGRILHSLKYRVLSRGMFLSLPVRGPLENILPTSLLFSGAVTYVKKTLSLEWDWMRTKRVWRTSLDEFLSLSLGWSMEPSSAVEFCSNWNMSWVHKALATLRIHSGEMLQLFCLVCCYCSMIIRQKPHSSVVAKELNLFLSSSYRYPIIKRSRHFVEIYKNDKKTHAAINNNLFKRLAETYNSPGSQFGEVRDWTWRADLSRSSVLQHPYSKKWCFMTTWLWR